MCDADSIGVIYHYDYNKIHRPDLTELVILPESLSTLVGKYLSTGRFVKSRNVQSTVYLYGKYRSSGKMFLFGVVTNEVGALLGFDITEDNASLVDYDSQHLLVESSNKELSEVILHGILLGDTKYEQQH